MNFAAVSDALESLRRGRAVIVVDDESRENEGDIVISAELATPETVAWMVRWTSGLLCAPMPIDLAERLELPPMVAVNEDARSTAYTVSVDATEGITTGISAQDRSRTLSVLAHPDSSAKSIIRPGHILPLRAVDGGVRERRGHTEATVDLMRLAGLRPVGAIAEVVADDGSMMRVPGLLALGARYDVPVITIEQLVQHLEEHEPGGSGGERDDPAGLRVTARAEALVPTDHGEFRMIAYQDRSSGMEHLAIVSGEIGETSLVRVHSECLTGEAFGSRKCECGPQLDAALGAIGREGGIVVYMRGHEGRGIGLIPKLHAYKLQEGGLDTVDANLTLGLPIDAREYRAAADILADLGVVKARLLTNNTDKVAQLRASGLEVVEQIPLIVGVGPENHGYLRTKRERMGHLIDDDELSRGLDSDRSTV